MIGLEDKIFSIISQSVFQMKFYECWGMKKYWITENVSRKESEVTDVLEKMKDLTWGSAEEVPVLGRR